MHLQHKDIWWGPKIYTEGNIYILSLGLIIKLTVLKTPAQSYAVIMNLKINLSNICQDFRHLQAVQLWGKPKSNFVWSKYWYFWTGNAICKQN